METINVYNYEDPRQFILDYFNIRQKENKQFSLRKWSKEMKLKSHSLLVMLLKGKRALRIQHCDFLNIGLDLGTNEKIYFKTLVQYQNSKSIEEKNLLAGFLQDLHPGHDFKSKDVTEFSVIAHWIHCAILSMTELKNFTGTENEIFKLLEGKVTLMEVRSALVRLFDLNLIEVGHDGKLKATFNQITSKNDIADEGVKEYHRKICDLAKEAIDEVSLDEREFQSFTLAIDSDKVPLAKDMIRKFRRQLTKAISGNGDSLYQTNIQFFRLTKNPSTLLEDKCVATTANTGELQ